MLFIRSINPGILALMASSMFLGGCATSIVGKVVKPDGSPLINAEVVVYTSPRTESIRVEGDGSFKITQNVAPDSSYTLIAEDREGNLGYVRGLVPKKGEKKPIVVRLSREVEAKDAALEGSGPAEIGGGPGEKILKSSQ